MPSSCASFSALANWPAEPSGSSSMALSSRRAPRRTCAEKTGSRPPRRAPRRSRGQLDRLLVRLERRIEAPHREVEVTERHLRHFAVGHERADALKHLLGFLVLAELHEEVASLEQQHDVLLRHVDDTRGPPISSVIGILHLHGKSSNSCSARLYTKADRAKNKRCTTGRNSRRSRTPIIASQPGAVRWKQQPRRNDRSLEDERERHIRGDPKRSRCGRKAPVRVNRGPVRHHATNARR